MKIKIYLRGQEVGPKITRSLLSVVSSVAHCRLLSLLSLSLSRSVVVVVAVILLLPLLDVVTAIIFVCKTLSIFFQFLQFSIP